MRHRKDECRYHIFHFVFFFGVVGEVSHIPSKILKYMYNQTSKLLAFVAALKRATDEGSLPDIAKYSPYYLP